MKRLSRLFQLVAFLGVVLATMEAASRVDDYVSRGAPITGNYDFERLFTFDGRVVRGVPHARYAKWALNSVGMRGPEPHSDAGKTRIAVYGASEAFGIYESDGKEFPRVLEKRLRERYGQNGLEVLNAGVPGMRVGSGTEYIRWLGERFHPRIVVMYPTPTHYIGVAKPLCGRPERPAAERSQGEAPNSRLLAKMSDRIKESLPRPLMTLARKAAIALAVRQREPLRVVDDASVRALEVDLVCALKAIRDIDAIPVLVTHANRFGAIAAADDAAWLTGWRMQYPELQESGFIDLERRANDVIRRLASAESVTLVETDDEISGRRELFADHAHFTDAGADRMGTLLARTLAPLLR